MIFRDYNNKSFILNHVEFESEYLKRRSYLKEKIGDELERIEILKEVRNILVNATEEDLDIARWITKTHEYDSIPIMQKSEYFLFKSACTTIEKRVDFLGNYICLRDKIARIIGMYNTYLLEEILGFQCLCMNLPVSGYYKMAKLLQVIGKRENIGPFLKPEIYSMSYEGFVNLLIYSKSVFENQTTSNEEKITLICDHINLLSVIDRVPMLMEIYSMLYVYSYNDKQILKVINDLIN